MTSEGRHTYQIRLFCAASRADSEKVGYALASLGYRVGIVSDVEEPQCESDATIAGIVVGPEPHREDDLGKIMRRVSNRPSFGILIGASLSRMRRLADLFSEFVLWPANKRELEYRLDSCQHRARALESNTIAAGGLGISRLSMIGESDKFLSALSTINKVAQYDHVVLVEGETGTGKELAARAVHYQGPRCNGPFVPLNCGLLNDTLLANELFGHRRGAYTDAADDHTGLIAQASGGSLFLDEVDALCARGQVSLLRVIEEKEFRPLGSSDSQIADIRILAASNRPLIELVEQGEFRADLYYRLSEVVIQMPPLRDRDQDVVLLARHFIDRCNRQWDREKSLSTSSIARLMNYGWPGNVRELQNLVNRQYLIQDEASIELDLPDSFSPSLAASPPVDLFDFAGTTFNEAKARILYEFEEYYLRWLLTQTGGNVTQAAKRAGKERRALGKLLKKHQIDRGDFDRRGHLSR